MLSLKYSIIYLVVLFLTVNVISVQNKTVLRKTNVKSKTMGACNTDKDCTSKNPKSYCNMSTGICHITPVVSDIAKNVFSL